MSDKPKTLQDLEDFLTGNEMQPKEETIAELRAAGVDTTQFFSLIKNTVQQAYVARLALAEDEQRQQRSTKPDFIEHLATMSRDTMLAIFKQLQTGVYGADYREAALARCRNKEGTDFSDEELRAWLEDVSNILGEPNDEGK